METYFLARLLGLTLIIVYGGFLMNQKFYQKFYKDITNQPRILFLGGFISLTYGLFVVLLHNIWEFDWRILITLIGWLFLIVGILRLLFPSQVLKLAKKISEAKNLNWINTASVVLLLVGVFLAYMGFFS